jgi:hypothetical protein
MINTRHNREDDIKSIRGAKATIRSTPNNRAGFWVAIKAKNSQGTADVKIESIAESES